GRIAVGNHGQLLARGRLPEMHPLMQPPLGGFHIFRASHGLGVGGNDDRRGSERAYLLGPPVKLAAAAAVPQADLDGLLMLLVCELLQPVLELPGGRSDGLAVGGESSSDTGVAGAEEMAAGRRDLALLFTADCIPEAKGAVPAAGGNGLAIRGEGHRG